MVIEAEKAERTCSAGPVAGRWADGLGKSKLLLPSRFEFPMVSESAQQQDVSFAWISRVALNGTRRAVQVLALSALPPGNLDEME
jgi:hypothetical protein